jgi:preprotein translocase subunit YajC
VNALLLAHNTVFFLAQATAPSTPATPAGGNTPSDTAPGWFKFVGNPMFLLGILLVGMLLFSSRSKKKQESERESMLKQMKRGDRVQTIGGILGTITRTEDSRIELKVDESSNAKIWFTRTAIHKVITETAEKEAK